MIGPIHRRIEGCLLDWVMPQADVDWWEALKKRYIDAGRPDEAPKGDWRGMKAESQAAWDPSITLQWEIDDIDLSRDLYPMHIEAVCTDGRAMSRRNMGYFASQAEARLFAAALLLTHDRPPLDEALRETEFVLDKDESRYALWERRLKSGDLSLKIVPERDLSVRRRLDRELHLSYNGNKARRTVPIVHACAGLGLGASGVNDPERAPHPATGVVDDPFVADVVAALAIADARLALGNIRKPLADGQEVAFIEEMIARRDTAPAP